METYPSDQDLNASMDAVATSELGVKFAQRTVKLNRLRLFLPKHGIAAGLLSLAVGSALALALALPVVFFSKSTTDILIPVVLLFLVSGFAAGWFPVWLLLRDAPGETQENRLELRSKALLYSESNLAFYIEALTKARQSLAEIESRRPARAFEIGSWALGKYPSDEDLSSGVAAVAALESDAQTARRIANRNRLRLFFPKHGIATWAVILVAGSALSLAMTFPAIFLFSASPVVLLLLVAVAFVLGLVPVWSVLRDAPGEALDNRVVLRSEALLRSERRLSFYVDALVRTRQALAEVKSRRSSVEAQRAAAVARLLAIEPGRLSPDEFERYVGKIFGHLGYATNQTGRSGDQGVDVLAEKPGCRIAIQAKRYECGVGNAAVQEVFAGMAHYRCHRCVVVTTSYFSRGAIELAKSTGCMLVGADEIPSLVRGELGL